MSRTAGRRRATALSLSVAAPKEMKFEGPA
jgi:hypothetical protein